MDGHREESARDLSASLEGLDARPPVTLTADGVLLDLDGVLIDSRAVIRRHWGLWAERHGFDPDQVVHVAHGRRPMDTVRRLMPEAEDPEALAASIVEGESSDAEGLVRLPGVEAFIASLPEGRWTVATSGPRAIAEFRLRWAAVPILSSMITAEDVVEGKPNPAPYVEAARRLGVNPERCVVVEDAPAGVRAGVAAGAKVIAVATTHSREELHEAGATVVVADLRHVRVTGGGPGEAIRFDVRP